MPRALAWLLLIVSRADAFVACNDSEVAFFHVPKTGGESINAFMRSANFNYTRIDRSQKFTTAMHALLNISLEHGTLQERNETSPRSKVELYLEIHVRLYLSIRPHKKCLDDNLYFPIMLLIL